MLIDPIIKFNEVYKLIYTREEQKVTKLETGIYLIGHLNFNNLINATCEKGNGWYFPLKFDSISKYPYGITDSPEQLLSSSIGNYIKNENKKFCVGLYKFKNFNEQTCKHNLLSSWGPYIGTRNIYNSKDINNKFYFNIFEWTK
jgi:hypothetical protein